LLFELHKLSTGFLKVVLGCDNIVIDTEIWNKVVLIVLIHVSLELLIGSGLSLEAFWEVSTIAGWD
jgi:hypothetical protein